MIELIFNKRFNAQRAAKRALKDPKAREGIDFNTAKNENGDWTYTLAATAKPAPAIDAGASSAKRRAPDAPTKKMIAAAADRAEARAAKEAAKQPKVKIAAPTAETAPTPAPKPSRMIQKYREILEAATRGDLPPVPDFTAETHSGYRGKLRQVVDMVERNDLDGLMAHKMRPTHTSPKMIIRYRDFAIHALKVRRGQGRLDSGVSQAEWEQSLIKTAIEFVASKSAGYGNYDERTFSTIDQAARAAAEEMLGRTVVYALLPCGRRLPVGRIKRGAFEATEAAAALMQ